MKFFICAMIVCIVIAVIWGLGGGGDDVHWTMKW